MPSTFHADAGGLWADQPAGSALDYTLDWSEALAGGDAIATSAWSADAGLVVGQSSFTDTSATAWLSGGLGGRWYTVANRITTSGGRTDSKTFRVFVRDAGLGTDIPSAFGDLAAAVSALRRDRLVGMARTYMPGIDLSDEYLLRKLRAAEKQVERSLRTFLYPREVVPQGATLEERAALVAADAVVHEEPGYDYDPRLFAGDTWGRIDLRQRPIIAVHKIAFAYPAIGSRTFEVPREWIRLDRKYGVIQLVPAANLAGLPLSSYLLSVLGGGSTVPFMVQVYYRAGLENVADEHPDILDVIQKSAALGLLEDQFFPSSASTSADGLSQSISAKADDYQGAVENKLKRISSSLSGIVFGVF